LTEQDKESSAITIVVEALASLDEMSRARVLEYATKRFAPNMLELAPSQTWDAAHLAAAKLDERIDATQRRPDIKALKDEKQPSSGIQMAVLVAYYLKELAPLDERKDAISNADVIKYFNQARYPLPAGKKGPGDTLNNSRRAGYLETAGGGLFKLNSVGFNLAAYNMPVESGKKSAGRGKMKVKKSATKAKK
jgi:hypothetical protein